MSVSRTRAATGIVCPTRAYATIGRGWVLLLIIAASFGLVEPALFPIASAALRVSTTVAIAKLRDEWVQDLRTKQLEPILKLYTSDASFLQPNGDRLTGSAALRSLFQTIMTTFNSDLTLHSRELEASGDLAYDSGDFEETLTAISTGAKINSKGSYIMIFKRQPNGAWLIVQQMWTGTPPPGT
jgi:ketosteroid isomerase-like protein